MSCSAAASALIAQAPVLATNRVSLALALAALVAGGSLLGHRGRVAFATATLVFVGVAVVVVVRGALVPAAGGTIARTGDPGLGAAWRAWVRRGRPGGVAQIAHH